MSESTGIYGPPCGAQGSSVPIELQGVPLATLQTWLGQAQQALQDLVTGAKTASVSYAQGEGSRMVTYTRANMAELRAWIGQLQLAANPSYCGFRRRPMRLRF
jgi:hypothetical protein